MSVPSYQSLDGKVGSLAWPVRLAGLKGPNLIGFRFVPGPGSCLVALLLFCRRICRRSRQNFPRCTVGGQQCQPSNRRLISKGAILSASSQKHTTRDIWHRFYYSLCSCVFTGNISAIQSEAYFEGRECYPGRARPGSAYAVGQSQGSPEAWPTAWGIRHIVAVLPAVNWTQKDQLFAHEKCCPSWAGILARAPV